MMNLRKSDKTWKTLVLSALTLFAVAGIATAANAQASNGEKGSDAYIWSAELVAFDASTNTATVKSMVVGHATMGDLSSYKEGDQVLLTWSGSFDYASGVRSIARGGTATDRLTMPVEFVSAEPDGRYVTFRVPVPAEHAARITALKSGQWVTASSPHAPTDSKRVVRAIRSYTDTKTDLS